MFKRLQVLVACTLLVSLASCVESDHPLSDVSLAQQDPDLLGLWSNTNQEGDINYVVVGGEESEPLVPARGEPEAGLMRYWGTTYSARSHKVEKPEGARFFCTRIGDDRYMNWVTVPNAQNPKPPSFFFLKYKVDGKQLTLWVQDQEATAQAVESGKLKGEVKRRKEKNAQGVYEIENIRLTDSSVNISAFIASGGAKNWFPDKHQTIYTRLQ